MGSSEHLDTLKRFLIDLPVKQNFEFTEQAKRDIRRALTLAISSNGEHLDWFFPKLFSGPPGTTDASVLETLDNELNWLFSKYVSKISKSRDPTHNTHNHHAYHSNLPCARIFRRGEPIYKCLTCGFDDTCALCSHCYQPEFHKGHDVHIAICQRENGGVCDCGDPEAWVNDFHCKYAVEDKEYASFKYREIAPQLEFSFVRTIEIILDYIIDVMCQSDLQFYSPWDVAMYPDKYSANCTLDPRKYGYEDVTDMNYDKVSEKYSLIAYNDQVRHFRDAVQRIHLASKKVPEFAAMVADKIQNHGRATVIRSRDVNLLFERQKLLSATGLASCIRNSRDEFREDMCHEILLWVGSLTDSEMFTSNDTFKNLFCQAFCCKWSKGLVSSVSNHRGEYCRGKLDASFNIPKVDSIKHTSATSAWSFEPSLWNLPEQICNDCNYNVDLGDYDVSEGHLGSRFQYMVYLDIRFWKSVRMLLHDIYSTSVITNLSHKCILSCQYVDIYPTIADMFLTIDGEPEMNIMCTLSTQLFTCPSNSTGITSHGDISRIFSTIYLFLRAGQIKSTVAVPLEDNKILMSSLKNRRWGQIFFDIGYILSRGRDKKGILTTNIIPMACDVLALFQGRPVMKREKANHVEYENSDYTAFFHAILVIYQYAEYIAHCITHLEDPIRREAVAGEAISYVINFLLKLELWNHEGLLTEYNDVDYGQNMKWFKQHGNDSADLGEGKVSFLHPIHSFLSWLIEYSNFETSEKLMNVFVNSVSSFISSNDDPTLTEKYVATIFEYPVRTIVLASQIKSGFWVRNGFSVRTQLQLYKNTGLREQGYLRDSFLVKVFTICSTPDSITKLFLKRWLLFEGSWGPSAADSPCPYEPSILPYIVEECLNFFIHLLTEDLFLLGLSREETSQIRIKNEIIHNLCFGPMNFSRLCSQIPDHISSEKRFDMILERLTTFKKPKTSKDTGTYCLKEEYFDDINPYYFNYSTNKKDDAIKFMKDRIHRATNKPLAEIVIYPRVRDGSELGIYKHLGNFTTSEHFIDFLLKTLLYIFDEGVHKLDGLLETTLHVIHICGSEKTIDFEKYGTFYDKAFHHSTTYDTSLATLLCKILSEEEFKDHQSKVRAIFKLFEDKYHNLAENLTKHVLEFNIHKLDLAPEKITCENENDRKKRVAKERQAKLMAKFKKQQSLFLKHNNCGNECSDTEMEDSDEEGWRFPESHCILCQDTAEDAGPFGIITYISKSSEFRNVPFDDKYWFLRAFSDKSNLNEEHEDGSVPEHYSEKWKSYMQKMDDDYVIGPGFTNQKHVNSKLVSLTCGHGMHFNCYVQFLASNRSRLNQITRNTPDSIEHREFLCPLCKAINNMFIPILWTPNNRLLNNFISLPQNERSPFENLQTQNIHDEYWFDSFCKSTTLDLEQFSILTPAAKEMIGSNSDALSSSNQQQFRVLLSNMFQVLSLLTFPQIFKADSANLLINSIKSAEISLRGASSNNLLVVHQISNNSLINLRALNEFRNTSLLMKISNWIQSSSNKPDAHVKILANLLALSPESFNSTILYSDFFELLVNVFPLPSTSFTFHSILSACFAGHLIQSIYLITSEILSHDFYVNDVYSILDVPFSELITEADAKRALLLFKKIRMVGSESSSYESIIHNPKFGFVLYSMLLKSMTPFLRQAAIYAYVCCPNTETTRLENTEELVFEADKLCSFLNISTLSEVLNRTCLAGQGTDLPFEAKRMQSFVIFLKKSTGKTTLDDFGIRKTLEYPGVVRLVKLPERLDHFFTKYYYLDKYDNPHLSIENPAICLSCSDVVDVQRGALGTKHGQCSTHFLKECSNSVGIFLLPKERSILLLHRNGGSFYDAPYLDQHGEIPGENKKGKTVYLLNERYDDFTRNVWLLHNVPNYIVRKLDSVIDAGGWETL